MTGAQLKHEIKKRGFTMKTVAQEIGQTAQNFGNKLASDDVSSALVESVAQVIGAEVADFYRQPDNGKATGRVAPSRGPGTCGQRLIDIIQSRDRQLDKAQAQIDRLLALLEVARP